MKLRKLSLGLLFLLSGPPLGAQQASVPSVEDVEALRAAAEASGAENREQALANYTEAINALRAAADLRARAADFQRDVSEAPRLVEALQAELSSVRVEPEALELEGLPLVELEGRLAEAQARLDAVRGAESELEELATYRTKRKGELAEEIAAGEQAITAAADALGAIAAELGEPDRRILLTARLEQSRASLSALVAERDAYDALREVVTLRLDRAARELNLAERQVEELQERVEALRAAEAEAAALEASERQEEIARRFPALRALAERSSALAELRSGESGLPSRISLAQDELDEERRLLDETRRRFRAARRRIAVGGLTEGMAVILRQDYEWLPSERELRRASEVRDRQLSSAQLEQIALQERRSELSDLDSATDRFLQSLGDDRPPEYIRDTARELLEAQRGAQDDVLDDLATLITVYYEHKDIAGRRLLAVRSYLEFIRKRILWVRSTSANPLDGLAAVPGAFAELGVHMADPDAWAGLRQSAERRAGRCVVLLGAALLLVAMRAPLKRKRAELGGLARSYLTDAYGHTVKALGHTLLLALPGPLLLWAAGWVSAGAEAELPRALGGSLKEFAVVWLLLRTLGGLFADSGVGRSHFRWPATSAVAVRRELRWFEPLVLLAGITAFTLDRLGVASWSNSVGRTGFVLAMVALALLSHRLLRVRSDLWSAVSKTEVGLLGKTHRLWSLLATGLPVVLAALSLAGYYYTALQLELPLRYSIVLALALVLTNAMLLRWLFIARRRLAVTQALEARARAQEEAEAAGTPDASPQPFDDDKVDIPAVDAQTRRLFKSSITVATVVGLYLVWTSVLPALQGLDRVQLLPKLAIVAADADLSFPDPSPVPGARGEEPVGDAVEGMPPVAPGLPATTAPTSESGSLGIPATLTLDDVLMGLVFLVLTFIATKNVPALLELSLLQKLPLDGGARYAVTTIVRYALVLGGVSLISGAVGIGWRQIQWLAAALTFGLAFGLQEIFANFVSGLIILFERPIRVGDIVTVGGVEGRVTQLRMRATTIQDWDRREFLVPNKEFITGSVVNWTLTDPVTRIVVPVGVAYGSDTKRAKSLLLRAARENGIVLEDPAPQVVFRQFGESSLDIELRVFIGNRDQWPQVVDQLHSEIDRLFRAAEIEIAFPQRDIHVRSAPSDSAGIPSPPDRG